MKVLLKSLCCVWIVIFCGCHAPTRQVSRVVEGTMQPEAPATPYPQPAQPVTPDQQETAVRWTGEWRAELPEDGTVLEVFESPGDAETDGLWFGFLATDLPQKYWWVDFRKWQGVKGVLAGTRRLEIPTVNQSAQGRTVCRNERDVRMLKGVEPILNEAAATSSIRQKSSTKRLSVCEETYVNKDLSLSLKLPPGWEYLAERAEAGGTVIRFERATEQGSMLLTIRVFQMTEEKSFQDLLSAEMAAIQSLDPSFSNELILLGYESGVKALASFYSKNGGRSTCWFLTPLFGHDLRPYFFHFEANNELFIRYGDDWNQIMDILSLL